MSHLNNTSEVLEAPSSLEKRGRGRPKGSKNRTVVSTKFGTVIENLSATQRKILDQFLFSATEASAIGTLPDSVLLSKDGPRQGRVVPQNDPKQDHVLLKSITISKNMSTGDWVISNLNTNHGEFETGSQQTSKINQKLVRSFVAYLKKIFDDDLASFIEDEQ